MVKKVIGGRVPLVKKERSMFTDYTKIVIVAIVVVVAIDETVIDAGAECSHREHTDYFLG